MSTKSASTPHFIWQALFFAWGVALAATLGALFIGEVMGKVPCTLCWYQRIFMFPLVAVLGVATYRTDTAVWRYALPLAVMGWVVAAYHTLLYFDVIPKPIVPCSINGPSCSGDGMVIFGFIPIPLLSVLSFTLITGLLLVIRRRSQ